MEEYIMLKKNIRMSRSEERKAVKNFTKTYKRGYFRRLVAINTLKILNKNSCIMFPIKDSFKWNEETYFLSKDNDFLKAFNISGVTTVTTEILDMTTGKRIQTPVIIYDDFFEDLPTAVKDFLLLSEVGLIKENLVGNPVRTLTTQRVGDTYAFLNIKTQVNALYALEYLYKNTGDSRYLSRYYRLFNKYEEYYI
jgi:hypothetical protein